jgi:hypothetical protein
MSAFLWLDTTKSLLMIIFTKHAWLDSLSNCVCSSFARRSYIGNPSDFCLIHRTLKGGGGKAHTLRFW